MNRSLSIITSLVVAVIGSSVVTFIQGKPLPDLLLLVAFSTATVVTALLVTLPGRRPREVTAAAESPSVETGEAATREYGKVKWFNNSKGFGFIIKEDGEEIFVHFRSIRGEGRRGLRDGQRVSFVVVDSDKGPQAEDVSSES